MIFHNHSGQILEQDAQRGYVVLSLEEFVQDSLGHSPEQPDQTDLFWAGVGLGDSRGSFLPLLLCGSGFSPGLFDTAHLWL